ncbi:MAG: DUF6603 domain-containing protein, partial [Sulfitobacter sp.]
TQLVDLVVDFVGAAVSDPPHDQSWHPITLEGKETGLNLVVGTTAPQSGGADMTTISLGLFYTKEIGSNPKIDGTVFILLPFLTFDGTGWTFVLGASTNPAQIAGEVKTDAYFTADGKQYNRLRITGDFVLDGNPPGFRVDFIDKSGATVDAFTTLSDLLSGSAVDWINVVLGISGVQNFLNTKIGTSTSETIASVLVAIKLLTENPFEVADLKVFLNQDPVDVAMNLLKEALDILATQEKPLIPVGKDGGFWVVRKTDGTKQRYGIRATLPDVGKSVGAGTGENAGVTAAATVPAGSGGAQNKPQALLQIGKWFTGEDSAKTSWLKRVDGSIDDELEPGAYAYLLEVDGSTLSFDARLELVSVGFDYVGGNDTPLIDVKGAKLGGFEPRLYLAMDLGSGGITDGSWGGGIRMDDLALPLSGDFDKTTGDNPVASNLLASGDGKGGDAADDNEDAVNPNFSVSAAGMGSEISVQLYGPDNAQTDRIWFPINRSFGPLNCQRIGVEWVDKDRLLSTLFDGGVTLGPLGVQLLGLSVGMKVTEPTNLSSYKLGLDGLNIEYKTGSIEITGGLLKDTDHDPIAYNGQARVKAGPFGLGALGSYTTIKEAAADNTSERSATSLFVFAFVDYPLGGPGFLFITGLAGGFGYNRALVMPKQDEVSKMPLVAAMSDPSAIGGAGATPTEALSKLGVWVPPTRGQNFIAAGIKFTTYELVNSIALLAVQFGNRLELDLLGVSSIKLPQVGPTFAYAELDLLVVLAPDEGVFKASLVLGPESFVLDPKCKLTGGFAFYAWFGDNAHAGNFVVTIGGYHPAFKPPDYYPVIPRLGFNWPVTTEISISGGAYFALTPSCAMGGGSLNVVFTSGGLKAWFTAHADLIIYWKPFYFDASIGVSIGASYTFKVFGAKVTLSVSLGADMELWGPPTGGKVHVSWFVISFTVAFGDAKLQRVPAIDWEDFSTTLPKSGNSSTRQMSLAQSATGVAEDGQKPKVVSINISEGLQKQMIENGENVWFIRPDEFIWFTKTTVPATVANLDTIPVTKNNAGTAAFTDVAVRPMGIASVSSGAHTITMTGENPLSAFLYDLDLESQPEAMWGKPVLLSTLEPAANLLDNCITGVKGLQPKPHDAIVGPPVIDAAKAFTFIDLDKGATWLPLSVNERPATSGGAVPSATTLDTIHDTLVQDSSARTDVFNALAVLGVNAGANGSLTYLAANPTAAFIASPMIGSVA